MRQQFFTHFYDEKYGSGYRRNLSSLSKSSVADPGCLSRIPDPTFFHPGSRIRTVSIPDPGSSKNLSILTTKKPKKWFLSSKKYDLGCSSLIPDPDADFLPIPDPGSRGQKGTQSRIPDPQHCPKDGMATKQRMRQTVLHASMTRDRGETNQKSTLCVQ
jgi:hypothetical protein